jgi:hypothetical protein
MPAHSSLFAALALLIAAGGDPEGRRSRGITDRRHCHRLKTIGNLKGGPRQIPIKAAHLMNREAERRGLRQQCTHCKTDIVLRVGVGRAVMRERGFGDAQNQNRRRLGPFAIHGDQGVEQFCVGLPCQSGERR